MFVQFDFLAQIIKIYFPLNPLKIHHEAMKSESLGVFLELKKSKIF
jgi:hypothetical protein